MIVASGGNGNGVTVFPGNADGTLGPGISYELADQVNDIAVGDFNRDGKLDISVVGRPAPGHDCWGGLLLSEQSG